MTTALAKKPNLNELTLEERRLLTHRTYQQPSYFQQLFKADQVEQACEPFASLFRQEIERMLLEKNIISKPCVLENLHEALSDEMKAYNFDDGVNKLSTYFYDTDADFLNVYHQFIAFLRNNFVKEPFWFQATPTIRLHCPNAKNSHHYPRYHSDISYGHPPEEINLWMPFTDLASGHSFKIMSVADSNHILQKYNYDFGAFIQSAIHDKEFSNECERIAKDVTTAKGKLLAFDSRCVHSGEPMRAHTRVSMDIRILPCSQFNNMPIQYQGAGRRKILFEPGFCYHAQNSESFFNAEGI